MTMTHHYEPQREAPEILHTDTDIVVAVKPSGLLAVPGIGAEKYDCLLTRLMQQFGEMHIAHRLDMATSGVMVYARTKDALRHLHAQFRDGTVDKVYEAIVAGELNAEPFFIEAPLAQDWVNRPLQKIDFREGKPSKTFAKLMRYDAASNTSRVQLEPYTGRTHQLRLHMKHIRHPILGDEWYGDINSAPRLLLHAIRLAFTHPTTNERLTFESAVPF